MQGAGLSRPDTGLTQNVTQNETGVLAYRNGPVVRRRLSLVVLDTRRPQQANSAQSPELIRTPPRHSLEFRIPDLGACLNAKQRKPKARERGAHTSEGGLRLAVSYPLVSLPASCISSRSARLLSSGKMRVEDSSRLIHDGTAPYIQPRFLTAQE